MNTIDLAAALAQHPYFVGLEPVHLAAVAGCARAAIVPAGTVLFREGDRADRFYVVRKGRVAIEVHAPSRGSFVVETLGAGDVVGWSWLFPPYEYRFEATRLRIVDVYGDAYGDGRTG